MAQPVITIARTYDKAFIDSMLISLAEDITTDQHSLPTAEQVLALPDCIAIGVYLDGVLTGLGILDGETIHTLFPPAIRGGMAVKAAKKAVAWIWETTCLKHIVSYAFSNRPEVLLFARLAGFKVISHNDWGDTIKGVPVTRYTLISNRI